MNDDTPEKRLRTIYNIVLGANVGFLPLLALYLLTTPGIDIGVLTAIAIWLLTTVIIVNEWWAALDLWTECPPIGKSNWGTFYHIFWNIAYVIPLLALPYMIRLESPSDITLLWYAILLIVLPIIDIMIVWPHGKLKLSKYSGHNYRPDVRGYIISDAAAILLFTVYILIIEVFKIFPLVLLHKAIILFFVYIIEFGIFYGNKVYVKRYRSSA